MDMTSQISFFIHPGFSVIIEMTGYFFSWATGNEFVGDTFKIIEKDIERGLKYLNKYLY